MRLLQGRSQCRIGNICHHLPPDFKPRSDIPSHPGQRLAGYVKVRVEELVDSVGQIGDARLLLMASLLVSDELSDAYAEIAAAQTDGEATVETANVEADGLAEKLESLAERVEAIAARLEAP